MIREPPPFFHRGPSPLARLTFFTIVAFVLMVADHRFRALETVRLSLSVLAHPVQQLAAMPGSMLGRVADFFTTQDKLLRENQALKAKILEQSAAAQEVKLLKVEHEQLLNMKGRGRFAEHGVLAEVIHNARNPFTRKIVIDKGLTEGIRAGMPVIDGEGVVGQVTNVGTFTSEVTLITEKDQSVPVLLVRNGLRAIAVGSGKDGAIDVPFMPAAADVQTGDLFVTSGIDGTYPAGLVVAVVTGVQKSAASTFARISARPAAGVENHRFVMVLASPPPPQLPPPETKSEEPRKGKDRPRARRDATR